MQTPRKPHEAARRGGAKRAARVGTQRAGRALAAAAVGSAVALGTAWAWAQDAAPAAPWVRVEVHTGQGPAAEPVAPIVVRASPPVAVPAEPSPVPPVVVAPVGAASPPPGVFTPVVPGSGASVPLLIESTRSVLGVGSSSSDPDHPACDTPCTLSAVPGSEIRFRTTYELPFVTVDRAGRVQRAWSMVHDVTVPPDSRGLRIRVRPPDQGQIVGAVLLIAFGAFGALAGSGIAGVGGAMHDDGLTLGGVGVGLGGAGLLAGGVPMLLRGLPGVESITPLRREPFVYGLAPRADGAVAVAGVAF